MDASHTAPPGKYVPLTMGSPTSRTVEVGPLRVTDAWFPPDLVLAPHLHDRSSLVVVLKGSFELGCAGKRYDCVPSTVLTEPLDEKHGNRFGRRGARVLVLQPDPHQPERFDPCHLLLDAVTDERHGGIHALAWRLAHELRVTDTAAVLAIQGIGLELMARVARLRLPRSSRAPAWLDRAEEMLRAQYLESITVEAVAEAVGVHPVHLARLFRRYKGASIGTFLRRLRLEWATVQLATTNTPIAELALQAGFSDQSHFTRVFREYAGLPPGRYRREARR